MSKLHPRTDMLRSTVVLALLLAACSIDGPVDREQAAQRAKTALVDQYGMYFPSDRRRRLQHRVDSQGRNWRVYFWDPEAGTGGDAWITVEKKTGRVVAIGVGQ